MNDLTGGGVSSLLARQERAERLSRIRLDEARCAWEYLTHGDTRGPHADGCVFALRGEPPCSRTYDPYADFTAPPDPRMYEGTGIGALYGYGSTKAYQLAGWNVRGRRTT